MIEKNETQKKKDLPVLWGELALLVVVLINSLGVVLMLPDPEFLQSPAYHMHSQKYLRRFPSAPGPIFSRDCWYYP